ncbi:sulfatase-like hydrolase/transferase [uncultured Jannaschia sp.]|uniref:sulfatase-like hydrolase/transferase n=1 Tax=uncultured Jannaschia sp. TaxID=293347 RepID=UPI0026204A5F|nr:sulfatase-like hydrolase/transferase [uncultured Jannaschia sp.]
MSGRPHVLLITVDQWPGHLLASAGHPVIETPTLDQLARIGVRYTNCYSEVPICIPARRSLMTGTTARRHGDRDFQPALPMPDLPTLAASFAGAGYQCYSTGKLHVFPPRDRIGFHDAMLAEEGRGNLGGPDDYEMFLTDQGHAGTQFLHGMSNNEYGWTTWHLPNRCHVTNWTTETAARAIKRRDPTRPALWNVSYTHPHPPLVPLQTYFDRYARRELPDPVSPPTQDEASPYLLRATRDRYATLSPVQLADMRRAFYALCTHIDHQIRVLIGTLREEGLLDDTIIAFTSDHGDMLGDHGLYGKRLMYDGSARVPLIVLDRRGSDRLAQGDATDDRLVALHDLMPTLLDLAEIEVPKTCDGVSLVTGAAREYLYGECSSGVRATRMVRDARHKLIWYAAGNRFVLFDMIDDPEERQDLSDAPEMSEKLRELRERLRSNLYGSDLELLDGEQFVGLPEPTLPAPQNRGLSGQRGVHFPEPPRSDASVNTGAWAT